MKQQEIKKKTESNTARNSWTTKTSSADSSGATIISAVQIQIIPIDTEATSRDAENLPISATKNVTKKSRKQRRGRRENSTTPIAREVQDNLSCTKHIGFTGMLVLSGFLFVSGGHFLLFYTYANSYASSTTFDAIGRPYVWVFLVFSVAYFIHFLFWTIRWKAKSRKWIELKYSMRKRKRSNNLFIQVKNMYYDNCSLNGTYYFYKLYASEFLENWVQFGNLIVVYSCTLPYGWNLLFSLLLICESLFRTRLMYRKLWGAHSSGKIDVKERNIQVMLDIWIDLFYLVVPLGVMWFVYSIPMSIEEILRIILADFF
eukprot:g7066.t1